MCGITGIISNSPAESGAEIIRMTDALQHRGPDGFGYVALDPGRAEIPAKRMQEAPSGVHRIFLGHRRLSIIDIEGSQQPLPNEDGSVWTVFNGEIYNYRELRGELEAKGHILREKGDTEVLVHLWEEYGEKMLEKLIGMFAFAIYDCRKDMLFLARDRFGQKPLFYHEKAGSLSFASELQALKQADEFPHNEPDLSAMAQYFRYGYIPSPKTAFKNVHALPPGHYLVRDKGKHRLYEYWRPTVSGESRQIELEELQELIDQSVKLRLRTDVPLGAFLSGGIDSALITSSAVKQLPEALKTFTIATGDSWCDESAEAQATADFLGTDHRTFQVKPDFVEISEKLARHYGQPFADHSSIMTYYVSRETRKHVTVALSGDGGDELFGGYGSYLNSAKYALFGRIPAPLRIFSAGIAGFFLRNSQKNIYDAIISAAILPAKGENISGLFHDYWRRTVFHPDFTSEINRDQEQQVDKFSAMFREAKSTDQIDRWMETDQRMYLANDILTKVDIASMAVSLECRAPFLDHRLANFANCIAAETKLQHGETKFLLKELARRQLQPEITKMPKKGFSMPLDRWLRNELKDWAYAKIFDQPENWETFLDKNAVKHIWQQHQKDKLDHSARLWQIICLAIPGRSRLTSTNPPKEPACEIRSQFATR